MYFALCLPSQPYVQIAEHIIYVVLVSKVEE